MSVIIDNALWRQILPESKTIGRKCERDTMHDNFTEYNYNVTQFTDNTPVTQMQQPANE